MNVKASLNGKNMKTLICAYRVSKTKQTGHKTDCPVTALKLAITQRMQNVFFTINMVKKNDKEWLCGKKLIRKKYGNFTESKLE